MLDQYTKYLNTWSPRLIALGSILSGLLIFYVDQATGFEIHVSVFYLIPTFLMTWYIGQRSGLIYGMIDSIALTAAESLSGFQYSHYGIVIWNTLVRAGFFIVVVVLADRLRQALHHEKSISRIDPLTTLYNSRGFYERAYRVLQDLTKEERAFTVAYIDLDNFKSINDLHGHETGDTVLRYVASVMLKGVGREDVAARFGGDEFVLLTQNDAAETPGGLLDRLRDELLRTMKTQGWPVTFSIGVVTFLVPPPALKDIVKMVDDLMYEVKRNGKDGISFYRYEAALLQSQARRGNPAIANSGDFQLSVASTPHLMERFTS